MSADDSKAVFRDPTGRRWRRVRGLALVGGVVSTLCAIFFIVVVALPPILPQTGAVRKDRELASSPHWAGTKARREHLAARRKLLSTLERERNVPAMRPVHLPTNRNALQSRKASSKPVISSDSAGQLATAFYVNWDDNSFASFRAHAAQLDWVICEWAFLGKGGDSVAINIDRRVPFVVGQLRPEDRPRVLLMVSNFSRASQRFESEALRSLLRSPAHMKAVAAQLAKVVRDNGLGGVAVDFEEIPDGTHTSLVQFLKEVRSALGTSMVAAGDSTGNANSAPLLIQALPADVNGTEARDYAAATDYLVLMTYDEHFGTGDAGPVASQKWYEQRVADITRSVPAKQIILALGAYGYDWTDAVPATPATEMTFQDIMSAVRMNGKDVVFDSVSRTPYLTWTDADSTDHVVWYLDAVTAYNEMAAGRAAGAAGLAVWRLGSEDPSLWNLFDAPTRADPTKLLADIKAGYDVEFTGSGELLRLANQPTNGERVVVWDSVAQRIRHQRLLKPPSPIVVSRVGGDSVADALKGTSRGGKKIALTFDDGPDPTWTSQILDTLRSRNAPATFFVIGRNALLEPATIKQLWREGHEVGNHTYTHPNLALVSPLVTRLELDATDRLLEALLNRRTAYFRPPYFGDAEPTTADELDPVGVATSLGYLTAGVHIDSEDWQQFAPATIIDTVLKQRDRGNVVLLHDGGGNRGNTVTALGPLIDSLRARGDTIVLLSGLIGQTRDQAMPPLPAASAAIRYAELAIFGGLGALELGIFWLFTIAILLGLGRLTIIVGLALYQRWMQSRHVPVNRVGEPPAVSVIVPAYNEEKVVVKTVLSLLEQQYDGPLEIVVVDDGSTDGTYAAAQSALAGDERVQVLTKPNGGKASALNFGIERARGSIVVGLDADTVFLPDTIAHLVAELDDPQVGAVAGNAKVGNRVNLITRWQAVEYVTSQNLDRRAFAVLNCITVVPGAVGAWRRDLVLKAGGFSTETLAEDQDLTLAISRIGSRIAYAERAVAYTEAPDTFAGLAKQRFRWSFGTLQCMWKHRDALLRPRYGALGMIAMPNVWLFQLLFAAISPLADLMFVWSLVGVFLSWREHGSTYAMSNLEQVITFYAVFLIVDWIAAVIAFLMEPDEDRRLTWLIFLQRFAYRQVMYWVVVRSFVAALRGQLIGWGKLERKATVSVPQ